MKDAGKESSTRCEGAQTNPWKMASEPGMLNDKAARDLPI